MRPRLALVVASAPLALLVSVVAEALGGNPAVVWVPWLAAVVVALLPIQRTPELDSLESFKRDQGPKAPETPRPRGDKGLKPVTRLSGTDPLDAIWGTTSRFPVAPDDLGEENPYHLRIDGEPEGDEPPR